MAARGVLIIVENLPVPNDRRVWLEATTLHKAGYRVSVISIKGKNATASHEVLEGINVYRYPAPPATSGALSFIIEFSYCWIMSFILSIVIAFRHGFDVIHACNPPETFWLIGLLYKPFGKKFLFDHHDLSPEMYQSRFGKQGTAYKLLILLERLTFLTANRIITTNETHKAVAIERGKVAEDKIYVVRSGPDQNKLRPGTPDEALKQGHRYMVAYLGVINPQDGVHQLIHVASTIIHEHKRTDILFVIMGTGDAEPDLRRLSRELDVDEHLCFTGWVEQDTIVRYLSTADVCVDTMPKTPYSDAATMNKILEYMSVARPIVCFDLVETRVTAGEAAVYVEPDNINDFALKLMELLGDEPKRLEMGKIGRTKIENHLAWEHQSKNLLAAYDALFEGK
jgi:glycosyltransferase involved in cell wall biosynthesis